MYFSPSLAVELNSKKVLSYFNKKFFFRSNFFPSGTTIFKDKETFEKRKVNIHIILHFSRENLGQNQFNKCLFSFNFFIYLSFLFSFNFYYIFIFPSFSLSSYFSIPYSCCASIRFFIPINLFSFHLKLCFTASLNLSPGNFGGFSIISLIRFML